MSDFYFEEDKELLEYGPVPGVLLSGSLFLDPFIRDFAPPYKGRLPKTLIFFRGGKLLWLTELVPLLKDGERLFTQYVLADSFRGGFNAVWRKAKYELERVMREIDEANLSTLSDSELAELAEQLRRAADKMEAPTVVPELANYGAEPYLRRLLKGLVPTKEIAEVMNKLTAPEELSFNQREEIELSETNDLDGHQQGYFWLQNGFGAAHVLPVDFFAKRKKKIGPNKKDELKAMIKGVKESKAAAQEKWRLPEEIMTISREMWLTIVMQDERKKYNFMAGHYADVLMREVARRFNYDPQDLLNAWFDEVIEIIRGKELRGALSKRRDGLAVAIEEPGTRELIGEEMQHNWEKYGEKAGLIDVTEIKGMVACRGFKERTVGRVRVVDDPRDASGFKEGEVLVAVMTSPDYIVAMRKAAAIVTNFGGLTSHAAIVSRELNIPCVIGTKIATQVLRDGDEVEVDTDKGIVKKL